MIELTVNGEAQRLEVPPDMPLLWALREVAGLTGTKYGCGIAVCGACTVHVDGLPLRSCVTPVGSVAGKAVTTIEGLDTPAGRAVKVAWRELAVPQCGFCQSGQIMGAAALLAGNPRPTEAEIAQQMAPYICRCCTYHRIRKAVRQAASALA
jgi:isoquinoline 1-oxidoreductase alpha subunit